MKRYDLADHCAEQGLLVLAALGDFIRYADHLAFVERVKALAEGMEHQFRCDTWNPGINNGCTCIRGELLAVCGEVK